MCRTNGVRVEYQIKVSFYAPSQRASLRWHVTLILGPAGRVPQPVVRARKTCNTEHIPVIIATDRKNDSYR